MDDFKEKCFTEPSGTVKFLQLFLVVLCAIVGVVLIIIASVVPGNFFPLFTLIALFIIPIPLFICGPPPPFDKMYGDNIDFESDRNQNWKDIGYFTTSCLGVSAVAVPAILRATGAIDDFGIALSIIGAGVLACGCGCYCFLFQLPRRETSF